MRKDEFFFQLVQQIKGEKVFAKGCTVPGDVPSVEYPVEYALSGDER